MLLFSYRYIPFQTMPKTSPKLMSTGIRVIRVLFNRLAFLCDTIREVSLYFIWTYTVMTSSE